MATAGSSESKARQVSLGIREIGLHDIGAWAVVRILSDEIPAGQGFPQFRRQRDQLEARQGYDPNDEGKRGGETL